MKTPQKIPRTEIVITGRQTLLSAAAVRAIVRATLARSGVRWAPDAQVSVAVVFVSTHAIHTLNRTYRDKDAPTDVLSFPDDFAQWSDCGTGTRGNGNSTS